MITKWWKKVVGTITANQSVISSSGVVTATVNLFDVTGVLIPDLITSAIYTNTSDYVPSASAPKNNATLLGVFSTDINPETAVVSKSYQKTAGACKMVFGGGTTTPTNADYNLESPIADGITIESYNLSYAFNEDSGNYEHIITANGTVSEDTLITEVGIVKSIWTSGTYSNYATADYYSNILVCREILAEPLDLKAGDSFTASIMIEQ